MADLILMSLMSCLMGISVLCLLQPGSYESDRFQDPVKVKDLLLHYENIKLWCLQVIKLRP